MSTDLYKDIWTEIFEYYLDKAAARKLAQTRRDFAAIQRATLLKADEASYCLNPQEEVWPNGRNAIMSVYSSGGPISASPLSPTGVVRHFVKLTLHVAFVSSPFIVSVPSLVPAAVLDLDNAMPSLCTLSAVGSAGYWALPSGLTHFRGNLGQLPESPSPSPMGLVLIEATDIYIPACTMSSLTNLTSLAIGFTVPRHWTAQEFSRHLGPNLVSLRLKGLTSLTYSGVILPESLTQASFFSIHHQVKRPVFWDMDEAEDVMDCLERPDGF